MAKKTFVYGDGNTHHKTGHLDVEIGPNGNVQAVWFRCLRLPFKVSEHGRMLDGEGDVDRIVNIKVEKDK